MTVLMAACGGGGDSITNPTLPVIAKRVLVANEFFGNGAVVDADRDVVVRGMAVTGTPAILVVHPKQIVLSYSSSNNVISIFDLTNEQLATTVTLPGAADSLVLSSDGRAAYAALRNSSQVAFIDIINRTVTTVNNIPQPRRLVLSGNGSTLLVFRDDSDSVILINTSDRAVRTIGGFDRAYSGVFTSDSARAFILSCGAQCGGTSAQVQVLDIAPGTISGSVPVNGATTGLLSGTDLYVAGTSPGGGRLDVVNTGSLTVTRTLNITDGLHHIMALGSNNRLFIGANTCSNLVTGCLSMVNVTGNTVAFGPVAGDVASLVPIPGRNVVYVLEGGNLQIYDTTTDSRQVRQIDFTGRLSAMAYLD